MSRKQEQFYTTGEFADYFNIKKDTLLYYDKIGLFSPACEDVYITKIIIKVSPFTLTMELLHTLYFLNKKQLSFFKFRR